MAIGEGLVRQVKEQMEEADDLFENNIQNMKPSDFSGLSIAKKRSKAHIMGVVIEQYLKSLLLWKGKSWQNLKDIGHGLADLYSALDDEGKKIFKKMLKIEDKKNVSFSSKQASAFLFDSETPRFNYMSLHNGQYDGVVDFPGLSGGSVYTSDNVEELLKKIKVPDYRYSQNQINLSDKDLIKMYEIVKCLNVLSRMARGENRNNKNYNDSKPRR